ncbi:MAG: hypothetical protein ACK5LT_10650, partial [Lachnospirales bacterium]
MQDRIDFKNNFGRSVFHVFNIALFVFISILMFIPRWKVVVESLDAARADGRRLIPREGDVEG